MRRAGTVHVWPGSRLISPGPDRRAGNITERVATVAQIASEALVERLIDWGVDTVFGLPGDGINGIMEGLRRRQDKLRFVLVHHEEAAAFMATALLAVIFG
jgi:hypothetical protein